MRIRLPLLGKNFRGSSPNNSIHLPTGEVLYADQVFRECYVQVDDAWLEANLIPLELVDLDIILGMDWLEKHHASVDCFRKEVTLRSPEQPKVIFGENVESSYLSYLCYCS
ncbi:unnamed protein product [Prunus armeniaca]